MIGNVSVNIHSRCCPEVTMIGNVSVNIHSVLLNYCAQTFYDHILR